MIRIGDDAIGRHLIPFNQNLLVHEAESAVGGLKFQGGEAIRKFLDQPGRTFIAVFRNLEFYLEQFSRLNGFRNLAVYHNIRQLQGDRILLLYRWFFRFFGHLGLFYRSFNRFGLWGSFDRLPGGFRLACAAFGRLGAPRGGSSGQIITNP
jgi:hypothetical protein